MVRKVFVSHSDWNIDTKFVSYGDSLFVNAISSVEEMTLKNFEKYNNAIIKFFYLKSLEKKKRLSYNEKDSNIEDDYEIGEYFYKANKDYRETEKKMTNKEEKITIKEEKTLCSIIANCLKVNC